LSSSVLGQPIFYYVRRGIHYAVSARVRFCTPVFSSSVFGRRRRSLIQSRRPACRCARLPPPNNTPTELLYKCANHSVMNLLRRNALKSFGYGKLNNSIISTTYSMVICLQHELSTVFSLYSLLAAVALYLSSLSLVHIILSP